LWAQRSQEHLRRTKNDDNQKQFLFGIVQGATYQDLREQSARKLIEIGFDGYAIGGISVGEPIPVMFETLDWVMPVLPQDKLRYFMGIGLPDQIVQAVSQGVDMFDTCVPTRFGRHGSALTSRGRVIIKNAAYAKDFGPVDETCSCQVCRKYSRSYIRHLLNSNEILGLQLVTFHNVYFYVHLMKQIREAINHDRYEAFQKEFLEKYHQAELENVC
jgi:queuine tRNA-ribosyltransferase